MNIHCDFVDHPALSSLRELSLSWNKFDQFPSIESWNKLKTLSFEYNLIKSLPGPTLSKFQSLTEIKLTGNKNLKSLPEEFGNLVNLKVRFRFY